MVRAGTKANFTLALGWLRCGFPLAMIHRTVKKSFTVEIAFPILWSWDLNAARAFLAELYCPVAACWSSSQPPSFRRGIHGESVPRDLIDSQVAAGAEPCDPGAKHREVVEMQPGRSTLLPCGDEWFGFSVVSKIDRYPNFKSLGCKFGAHLHCLGYRKERKAENRMEKECSPPKRILFRIRIPHQTQCVCQVHLHGCKSGGRVATVHDPKGWHFLGPSLAAAGPQDVEVRKAWTRPDNSLPEGHLVANLARMKFSINLPVPNRKRGQKEWLVFKFGLMLAARRG